jgi:MFS family permease
VSHPPADSSPTNEPQVATARSWRSRNVLALGLVSFLTDIHSETILALLPQFMADVLHLPKSSIGLIEGLADATASLLKIASGWFSDHIGRRKPLVLAGYAISTAMKPLLYYANGMGTVLAVRLFDRVGKGVRTSARDALVAESVDLDQRGKAFGFHRAMDTAGAVVGTTLAIILIRVLAGNYRQVFLVATLAGLGAVVTVILGVHEIRKGAHSGGKPKKKAEASGSFAWFLAAHTVFSAGNFSYAFFLLRAQDVGVAGGVVPVLYLWHNVVYALAAFPAGAMLDRLGARRAQIVAYLIQVVVCLGLAFGARPILMPVWFAVYGLQLGATGSCSRATASALMRPDRRGTDMGMLNALEGVGLLIASTVGGALWDRLQSGAAPFAFAAATALVATVLVSFALKTPPAPIATE